MRQIQRNAIPEVNSVVLISLSARCPHTCFNRDQQPLCQHPDVVSRLYFDIFTSKRRGCSGMLFFPSSYTLKQNEALPAWYLPHRKSPSVLKTTGEPSGAPLGPGPVGISPRPPQLAPSRTEGAPGTARCSPPASRFPPPSSPPQPRLSRPPRPTPPFPSPRPKKIFFSPSGKGFYSVLFSACALLWKIRKII